MDGLIAAAGIQKELPALEYTAEGKKYKKDGEKTMF